MFLFCIVANHMYLLLRSNPHDNNVVRFDSCQVKPFVCFVFDLDLFLVFLVFRLSDCLCMLLFVYARLPGVRSLLLRISRVCRSTATQVTL